MASEILGAARPPRKRWAFLTYIAGDNNLSNAGLDDIQEMCDVGAPRNAYVGVEIDTYGEHTGSIRYRITEKWWFGRAFRIVMGRLREKDSGDPSVVIDFLRWGRRYFPADVYAVVIWNHGSGFRGPTRVFQQPRRDIAYDDFGGSLDMPEVELALRRGGFNRNRKIGVLGFDACLMNMLEVVHHLRDQVEVVVGSQQTEPYDGWPYHRVLRELGRARTPQSLGAAIVRQYILDYRRRGMQNVTQSAVLTAETEQLARDLSALGRHLARRFADLGQKLRRIRTQVQSFYMADYVDLYDLASRIRSAQLDARSASLAAKVERGVGRAVIANESFGSSVSDANGLSVWFPSTQDLYHVYCPKYRQMKFRVAGAGWIQFLATYHT